MRRVIDAGECESEDKVVDNKRPQAAQRTRERGARYGKLAQLESRDERASETEDGSGGADAGPVGIPRCAGQTGSHAADEIDRAVAPASVERFAKRAQIPQAPHVEGDVDDAAVNEHIGQQPPPFSRERERAHVGAPLNTLWNRELHDGGTGERHAQEYRGIDAEDYLSEADAGFAVPNPGRGHDALRCVVADFAALRGFVLHAPLADLLAKGQAGKLTATSNAVCHGFYKRVSAVWRASEGVKRTVGRVLLYGRTRSIFAGRTLRGFGSESLARRAATEQRPPRLLFSRRCKFEDRRSRPWCADVRELALSSRYPREAAARNEA